MSDLAMDDAEPDEARVEVVVENRAENRKRKSSFLTWNKSAEAFSVTSKWKHPTGSSSDITQVCTYKNCFKTISRRNKSMKDTHKDNCHGGDQSYSTDKYILPVDHARSRSS